MCDDLKRKTAQYFGLIFRYALIYPDHSFKNRGYAAECYRLPRTLRKLIHQNITKEWRERMLGFSYETAPALELFTTIRIIIIIIIETIKQKPTQK